MQKRALFAALMLSLGIFQLAAGDIAVFENLGFSEDSQYLLFAQYGIGAEDNRAYAELFAVDMAKNSFLPGGVLKKVYNETLYPGQNGSGALYMALRDFAPTIGKYKINHLTTGRLVYLLVNGAEPQKRLEFRDFQRGDSFVVDLIQNKYGENENLASSFHLSISITDSSGRTRSYQVGHPEIKRRGVIEYRIKRAFFSPDEKGLVFVIERDERDGDGNNIRYMVETLRW